jgi:hypothetical protein
MMREVDTAGAILIELRIALLVLVAVSYCVQIDISVRYKPTTTNCSISFFAPRLLDCINGWDEATSEHVIEQEEASSQTRSTAQWLPSPPPILIAAGILERNVSSSYQGVSSRKDEECRAVCGIQAGCCYREARGGMT